MDKKNLVVIVLAIAIYISATATAYFLFINSSIGKKFIKSQPPTLSTISSSSLKVNSDGTVVFDKSLPKTEPCPLNGALYSSEQRKWWEQHAPLGIMIENHQDSRPQSGLSYADVIYEAVAEGGITRFLAMFYCQDAPEVGPIRSARVYFINFLSEYGKYPLYTHVGGANAEGAANALGELENLGWTGYNDLNQFSIGFPTFWRDYNRLGHDTATEHTMYSTTGKLWAVAKTRGITNVYKDGKSWDNTFVPYLFKDDQSASDRGANQTVHLEFWTSDPGYFVDWIYDPTQNIYKRENGGKTHLDRDTGKQLTAKNLVVLYMEESHANDGYDNNVHLLYKDIGSGKAVVFMDGKKIQAVWTKSSQTARTMINDSNGNPIKFNRGNIWFSVLPLTGNLEVK